MQWRQVPMQLTDDDIGSLKDINSEIINHVEDQGYFHLKPAILNKLEAELTRVIAQHAVFSDIIAALDTSPHHYVVQLQHHDNDILNLPWNLAKCGAAGRSLGGISRLYLAKSIVPQEKKTTLPIYIPSTAAPLKILVMISSPMDSEYKSVLSYDKEEEEILTAFQPLLQSGEVEIDFTEDGSLESLQEKIRAIKYHIVHFSGHGRFIDNQGYLELENPLNLKAIPTPGKDFAEVLVSNPERLVPLVVLSSCQTAKGATEKGLCGVTNNLQQVGIPATIAMGMSIQDRYAASFSARFYLEIAQRRTLAQAFQSAANAIKEMEALENSRNPALAGRIPLQWIIPNLYLSAQMEQLVQWDKEREPIKHRSFRFLKNQNRIVLQHDKNYQFIGRREDKARILPMLFEKKPILLKGQGGVGKTSLAEKLVQRLIAKDPRTYPFVFDEKTKSIQVIEESLKRFLTAEVETHDFITTLQEKEKAVEKIQFLIFEVSRYCSPVFVFDNLESFQKEKGGKFTEEYAPIAEIIAYLCEANKYHVILTCRYPVPDFPNAAIFDLNQVRFNDFWKKCACLELKDLNVVILNNLIKKAVARGVPEKGEIEFIDIVRMLFKRFGGNFRALEFFNRLYVEDPQKIVSSLSTIEDFGKTIETGLAELREYMGENLFFDDLMKLLGKHELQTLSLLMQFRIPVLALALQLQDKKDNAGFEAVLGRLQDLTLVEVSMDRETKLVYYYATTLVKDLAKETGAVPEADDFSHETAGNYHYHISENIEYSLVELEEAFFHYYQAKNPGKINDIGDTISKFYYNSFLFRSAQHYCSMVYDVLGENTDSGILNRTGLILDTFGDLNNALKVYLQAMEKYRKIGDKRGEGTTLNNISQIYDAKGDYDTALSYLQKSLAIRQEIGDKSGEGTTLNNISQIFKARGDYDTALSYVQKSLAIRQEIGDKRGEGTTLNNICGIYYAKGDYDTALSYLQKSLAIRQEIGDKLGEGTTLNNISQIFKARGDYDTALSYLQKSLAIYQEIGDKRGEGAILDNIGQIYFTKSDYITALSYFQKSLAIQQEIGDKSGEGITLNNISGIYDTKGDYDTALSYLQKSLTICQEIGDKSGEGTTFNNIAGIYNAKGDYDSALSYLNKSLAICQKIGNKSGEGSTLNNISQIYAVKGDYDTALSYLQKSLAIRREIADKSGEGTTLNNISQIFKAKGDYDSALSYLQKSLAIFREIGDKRGEGTTLNNVNNIYYAKGDYDTALSYLQKSLAISQEIGDKRGAMASLHNMAMIAYDKNDWEPYFKTEMRAYSLAMEIQEAQGVYTIGKILGNILCSAGQKAQGLPMLQRAYDIGVKAGYPDVGQVTANLQKYQKEP